MDTYGPIPQIPIYRQDGQNVTLTYQPRRNDESLRERLVALAREKPRFGYRRLHVLLGREGEQVNHKRVHRIYREAGLALRRKKRKHCVRAHVPLGTYTEANQEWALDFVHDVTASGRSLRMLNVIDAYTRESLAMEVDTSFAGLRLTRALDGIIAERGLPQAIQGQRRTAMWRVSTASCARSACAATGSRICSRPVASSPTGDGITTNAGRTQA